MLTDPGPAAWWTRVTRGSWFCACPTTPELSLGAPCRADQHPPEHAVVPEEAVHQGRRGMQTREIEDQRPQQRVPVVDERGERLVRRVELRRAEHEEPRIAAHPPQHQAERQRRGDQRVEPPMRGLCHHVQRAPVRGRQAPALGGPPDDAGRDQHDQDHAHTSGAASASARGDHPAAPSRSSWRCTTARRSAARSPSGTGSSCGHSAWPPDRQLAPGQSCVHGKPSACQPATWPRMPCPSGGPSKPSAML